VMIIADVGVAMLPSRTTEGGSQTAHDGVSVHGEGATGQTGMENLSSQSGDEEPVELITALGVFDPNLVLASALAIDFQDQWVCTCSCSIRA
jgi:hypothetical protein